ncbi:MAG: hypothetical protein FD188_3467, partial [Ignavibacteria bacterium]
MHSQDVAFSHRRIAAEDVSLLCSDALRVAS